MQICEAIHHITQSVILYQVNCFKLEDKIKLAQMSVCLALLTRWLRYCNGSHFIALVTDLVNVVVEQLINEIHMREEHPAATVPRESQRIQNLAHILFFLHLLSSLAHQLAKLFPLMRNHFTTTKTTDWNDHLDFGFFITFRKGC